MGINSFGFGGSNTHVILRPAMHEKKEAPLPNFMKIVTYAGRTTEGVMSIFDAVAEDPDNVYFQQLLANQANMPAREAPFRGYMIMHRDKIPVPEDGKRDSTLPPLRDVQKIMITEPKQIYFVYSGKLFLKTNLKISS